MKKLSGLFAAVLAGAALLLSAAPAMARVNVDVHVGVPAPVYVSPHPVYVHPRPVYVQPRPVYVHPSYYRGDRYHHGYYKHRHHRQDHYRGHGRHHR